MSIELRKAKALIVVTPSTGKIMNRNRNEHDDRHGGPYDRGSADAWYRRPCKPHYYKGGTGYGLVERADMTEKEIVAYTEGWNEGMAWGEHKEYC